MQWRPTTLRCRDLRRYDVKKFEYFSTIQKHPPDYLNGAAGSIDELLDAVLVPGFAYFTRLSTGRK
jgi:hypothetical protein